jgi:hypothetical protein
MRTTQGFIPAYNVHAAVDAEHALIVAQQVSDQAADNRSLQPIRADSGERTRAAAQCCSRCGLLEWRAGRSLRG